MFLLLLLIYAPSMEAKKDVPYPHKQRMIKYINQGRYKKAIHEMPLVENWTYNADEEGSYLYPSRVIELGNFTGTHQLSKSLSDSLFLYVTEECLYAGVLFMAKGDVNSTTMYHNWAESFFLSVYEEHHPFYASFLNSLGALYQDMGNYAKAEQFLLHALQIGKSVGGEQHPDYATTLNNLGSLYTIIGNYAKAEQCYLEALQICKLIFGEQHSTYATTLNNLGVLYNHMGDYAKAEQCYLEALQIYKLIFGERHSTYATTLNNLGVLYNHMGDYAKAETYHLDALQIQMSLFGERQHIDYATTFNNLGSLYTVIGDYAKAELCLSEASKILTSLLGEQHPEYASTLNHLGLLYVDMNNYAQAEHYYTQSIKLTKNHFIESTDYMTEQQRGKYWNTMQVDFYKTYPTFSYRYNIIHPSIAAFTYDNELFTKGLLLASSNSVRRSILESNDTTLIRQWNDLTTKKQQIQVWEEKDPQSQYLADIRDAAEQLEKEVTKRSAALRESRAQWSITWDSVRNRLRDNEIAIEYFTAPLNEDSTMYCALLLRHDSEYPTLIPLFEGKEVSSLANVTTESGATLTYAYKHNGNKLSHLVWDKILPYVKESETIYFAPSGLLHQLAIEALPYDEKRTMADVYNLVRLSSTREIVLQHNKPTDYTTATLYGGIQYNMTDTEFLAESEPYEHTNLLASRGIENDTLDRGSVKYLPGTLAEVEDIQKMLDMYHIDAKLYKAKEGNEESFKSLSGQRQNILHIATHGFFWTDSIAQHKDLFSQRSMIMSFDHNMPTPAAIDPLNRCGLLLAGANTALSGHSADLPDGVQDGILTAKEISLLDLRDANLVVLSACKTGLGEIMSEGVFGLQRAFKQAGAQTIIMSLWKVNDESTKMLMTEFYRDWLTLGQSKRQAFLNAQNYVRKQRPEPKHWAGFIMID